MPPKQAAVSDADNVLTLCHLMATCTEFKADSAALAPILNIAQAKNVPRKINSIIGVHGFELRGGKVVDTREAGQVPSTPGKPDSVKSSEKKAPSTPTNGKKSKKPPTPASKKRKVAASEDSDSPDPTHAGSDQNDDDVKGEN